MKHEQSMKERILSAALTLLREQGADAASARAICDHVGIKAPTIYHYFGNLGNLHQAVVDAAFTHAVERKQPVHSDNARTDIEHGWDAYVMFAMEEPALFDLMNRQMTSAPLSGIAMASYVALVDNFRRLHGHGLRTTPELAAQITWAAAHGVCCFAAAARFGTPFSVTTSTTLRNATLNALLLSDPDSPSANADG